MKQRHRRPRYSRRDTLRLLGTGVGLGVLGPLARHAHASVTLDDIKSSGVFKVGVEAAYPPFQFRDKGEIVGFDIDLINLYCSGIGVEAEYIDTAWSGIIPALYAGRFEAIPGMTITKERVKKVDFSIPYCEASQAMLVREEDKDAIKTLDDMSGKVLGLKIGSPGEVLQHEFNERITKARGAGFADVKLYDDHPAAYLALAQGTVDGVLNTLTTLAQVLIDRPGYYAIMRGFASEAWFGLATRMEDDQVTEFLSNGIQQAKASGDLYDLHEKWFGIRMEVPNEVPTFE